MPRRRIELTDAQADNVDAGILNLGDLRRIIEDAQAKALPPEHPPAPWFDVLQFQAAKKYLSAESAHNALAKLMRQGMLVDRTFRLGRNNRALKVRCYRAKPD